MEKNRYTKTVMPDSTQTSASSASGDTSDIQQLPLDRINFKLMAVSAVIIIAGFLLMLGPSAGTEEFNPDIYSVRRVVIAPTVTIIGFIAMAFAIIYGGRDKKHKEDE